MSDSCWLWIRLREEHLQRFIEITGAQAAEMDSEKGFVSITEECAPYAYYDPLRALAEEGIPFYGHHGNGGNYGAMEFCGVGGDYLDALNTFDNQLAVYANETTGIPTERDLQNLQEYVAAKVRAKKEIGVSDDLNQSQ